MLYIYMCVFPYYGAVHVCVYVHIMVLCFQISDMPSVTQGQRASWESGKV